MTTTLARPAYRQPWQHGAYAYPQADTLAALAAGVKRKRKPLTVHVAHSGVGTLPCAACGLPLGGPYRVNVGDDPTTVDSTGYAYGDVSPKRGTVVLRHYYCAWGALMERVIAIRLP